MFRFVAFAYQVLRCTFIW